MRIRDNTAFLDLLFNTLLGFVVLFFISFYMIHNPERKADIRTKAEFVITVTWPSGMKSDVDTWLRDPLGEVLYFRHKEGNLMHLDRDDLGNARDEIVLSTGETIIVPHNQELTTIRGIIPGEWTLNVHMYKKRDEGKVPVAVAIDKLNPEVKKIFYRQVPLSEQWEEITVTRFSMTEGGDVIGWDDLPMELIKTRETIPHGGGYYP